VTVATAYADTAVASAHHLAGSREHPLLAVTFDVDGTWHAVQCPHGAEIVDSCSVSCGAPTQCSSGTYTYNNGVLDASFGNGGRHAIDDKGPGELMVEGLYGKFARSNLVRVDALPACR
jgi:hypothetical protein